ncbi:MAG: 2-succinyl-6-hydroxy-2,4-cyclohexadiene-1-carboxylate synthase [Bacteroidetes bacterium CG12_big_fil_rev_8_21_14_0_65_60_17]|nr:MAG: 2-succinyl-6-hydroxy-2,4-cyclohexadiene-1-carboxylate synthase [Bacteroidetes bacterium CG12_big_fil_rev_8_21_14_0_65_60_17]
MLFHRIYRHEMAREWVVFVHGAGGSSVVWFKQIRAFRPWFNILLVDLRGHGKSASYGGNGSPYSLEGISSDILDVMDHRGIRKAHFVGVSLGTILIRTLQEYHPERVRSAVYAGAVVGFTAPARVLIAAGHSLKYIIPFRALYAVFAWIIMPGSKAQEARKVFRREARSVRPAEFRRWLRLTREVHSRLAAWSSSCGDRAPTLYVMGARDYLFLPPARKAVEIDASAELEVVERAGHVCNIEQPARFNQIAIAFLKR